ncbi:MAG: hypothetical protein ACE5HN_00395 [Nitrospiria bacterium]
MKDIIDKLASYNIFNYLFPGILFAVIVSRYTPYFMVVDDIIVSVFVYYFYGLVISRIGSLLIEPILRKTNFAQFAPYAEYVAASKADEKIEILSEINNMYRTLISVLICILSIKVYSRIEHTYAWFAEYTPSVLLILLLVLFVYSYKKQTEYIVSRVMGPQKGSGSDTEKEK